MTEVAWIVGVDPGKTTGSALLWTNDPLGTLTSRQDPALTFLDHLRIHLKASRDANVPGLVACENFIITPSTARKSQQTDALEVIGAVHWLCHHYGAVFDRTQSPASAKTFASDQHLKKWNVYDRQHDHANDGTRHALLAAMSAGYRDWIPL